MLASKNLDDSVNASEEEGFQVKETTYLKKKKIPVIRSRDGKVRSFKTLFFIYDECMSKISTHLRNGTSHLTQHFLF